MQDEWRRISGRSLRNRAWPPAARPVSKSALHQGATEIPDKRAKSPATVNLSLNRVVRGQCSHLTFRNSPFLHNAIRSSDRDSKQSATIVSERAPHTRTRQNRCPVVQVIPGRPHCQIPSHLCHTATRVIFKSHLTSPKIAVPQYRQ